MSAVETNCPLCGFQERATTIVVSSGTYHLCSHCDLLFQDPAERLTGEAEHAYYLTHENDVDDPRYRAFLSALAIPLMQRLSPGAEGLDYGSGPGPALAAMLNEQGFPTAVYDPFFAPDDAVLEQHYDFIACTEVAEHMHHPCRDFAMLDALLRRGGWLGLMTELRPAMERFSSWHYHRDPTHVCFHSEASIRWIARRFGWHIDHLGARVILLQKR